MTGTRRIRVSNFDPLQQAQLWRSWGADEATKIYTAMLRTAILLGEELVLDRNDLLDGIYFLSLGPTGVAQRLGLTPADRLPITMIARPADPADDSDPSLVPPPHVARTAGTRAVSLDEQLDHVSSKRYLSASSAYGAVMTRPAHDDIHDANSWLMPPPADAWFPGAGLTDRFHPFQNPGDAVDALRSARETWTAAAAKDRFTATGWTSWSDLAHGPGTAEHDYMARALAIQSRMLDESSGRIPRAVLAHAIVTFNDTTERKTAVKRIDALASEIDSSAESRRLALELWSRGYNQALAWKDDCVLLTFDRPTGEVAESALELLQSNGLAPPPTTRRELILRRLRSHPVRSDMLITIEGEILDHMRVISPYSFQELVTTNAAIITRVIEQGDPSGMYGLALACRESVERRASAHGARRATVIRSALITAAIAVIAAATLLGEYYEDSWVKWAALLLTTFLSALAGLPWDDVIDIVTTRRSALSATLNISARGVPDDR